VLKRTTTTDSFYMADDSGSAAAVADGVGAHTDEDLGYKTPDQKTLDEIVSSANTEDDAMKDYTKKLLPEGSVVVDANNPSSVILKKLAFVVEGRDDLEIDLTGDLSTKPKFDIKEGIKFKIRIDFMVQREIVTGLKYVQKTSRMGVPVDKMNHMVGSYAPKTEVQSYTTPIEDAPGGLAGRGTYHVYSLFTDDDKKEYLKWEWYINIKRDW